MGKQASPPCPFTGHRAQSVHFTRPHLRTKLRLVRCGHAPPPHCALVIDRGRTAHRATFHDTLRLEAHVLHKATALVPSDVRNVQLLHARIPAYGRARRQYRCSPVVPCKRGVCAALASAHASVVLMMCMLLCVVGARWLRLLSCHASLRGHARRRWL